MNRIINGKWKSYISFLCVVALLFLIWSPMASASTAASDKSDKKEKQVKKIAKDLEFIFEKATKKQNGKYIVNKQQIANKFGQDNVKSVARFVYLIQHPEQVKQMQGTISKTREANRLTQRNKVNGQIVMRSSSWSSCMGDALLDMVGKGVYDAIIHGGIMGLLKKKAYREAAKLILKFTVPGSIAWIASELGYNALKCKGWVPWASMKKPQLGDTLY